jgi:hypothetical protein
MILNVITIQLNDSALADHNDGLFQDIVKHGVKLLLDILEEHLLS